MVAACGVSASSLVGKDSLSSVIYRREGRVVHAEWPQAERETDHEGNVYLRRKYSSHQLIKLYNMKKDYMKPALQVVKLQQQSSMLLPASGTPKVTSVYSNADIDFADEGSDGEARGKRRNFWDE